MKKYGGINVSDAGRLRVLEEENKKLKRLYADAMLRWTESGGPPVIPPTRTGFGSRLVRRVLAAELGGQVDVAYEPSGVVCTIDAPVTDGQARGEMN